jgi:hypothetical protein
MRALGEFSLRLVRRATAVAETRRGVAIVFAVALVVWWLEALIIPLDGGRDLATYLGTYAQLFQRHPIDLGYILDRTPLAALVVGGLLDLAHGAFAEPVVSVLYAASIVAWFLAARVFSAGAAVLTAVVLVLFPGYGILFHELSSDSVFAAAFAGWSLLAVHAVLAPSWRRFALLGLGVGVLALIRPGNAALLVLAAVPLALRASWRTRLVTTAAFLVPAIAIVIGWTMHNGVLYGDYTFARGGDATIPFFRTFVTDRIVRPSNGPESEELARAVQRDLLPYQPYRAYHITLHEFFADASPRMQTDLVALSDRVKGFDTNDRWLREVGVEAVRTHTHRYVRGVSGTIWGLLTDGLFRPPPASASTPAPQPAAETQGGGLPTPTEGEPIPAPHEGGVATPDQSIYTVWTSPTEHHLVFVHPGAEARYIALHKRMDALATDLPDRGGSPSLAHRMNQASRWYPPALVWLVFGIVAVAFRRPRSMLALWVPSIAGLIVVVLSALGLPAEPHYSVPVAPAFVVLASAGLFGPRRAPAPLLVRARRLAGIAIGVLAALWAIWIYFTIVDDYAGPGHNGAPNDLLVFLGAAGKVIHGHSPYAFQADKTYAYPPLLAYVIAPLHPLRLASATIVWTLFSFAAISLALWLLGLRDWRCYALAAIYRFTRSAVDLGSIAPLLLLAVAVMWRWRDEIARPAVGAGVAIALKLFLWPVALWLALTRRMSAALVGVGVAAALVILPWAGIAFAGFSSYPGLLHRLADEEASSSYSGVALGVRAHLPQTVALVLSLVAAAAILVAAALVARDQRRTPRERDVVTLTLALAAALAASPIVWMHYFLLLLVPLALARPRLSLLWFVPLAYYPLGDAAWPAGDALKLAIAFVTTLVILGACVVRPEGRALAIGRLSLGNGAPLRLPAWSRIRSST